MRIIYLKNGNVRDVIMELNDSLNGSLNYDSSESKLSLNNAIIKGNIEAISFNEGMSYLQFDIVYFEDVILNITSLDSSPIYFVYCSQGTLKHSFGNKEDKKTINEQHIAVVNAAEKAVNMLYFKKGISVSFSLISVDSTVVEGNDSLNMKLKNTLSDKKESFRNIGLQHFKIEEKIEQLRAITQKGIVGSLLKKGVLQIIVAMEIEQHVNFYNKKNTLVNCLTLKQISQIKEATNCIKKDPSEQYSIKFLAKKTGLSPNKLQEGFKLMHNRTVNDFITLIRIEKAEKLILNSDLNISEIVYSIGFSSRSYFSKIFKEKYNCSPKEYKYAQNSLAITA